MIAGFTDLAELAVGGFGVVYHARDPDGRPVAIKVLLAEHVGSHAVERFEQEIAIVRRLAHPGIVAVHDAGRLADGRPYCVMELLHGRDLASLLAAGPLSPARAVAIVAAVGGALAVAHAAGVIHRDVKPSNVFACDDGRVVLLDFGIAKLVESDARLTLSRQTLGTAGAMAPEQLAGGNVDARTDIYALGALAYHALAGSPAFSGDGAAQLHRFAQRPKPSASGAPAAFDAIVARAMAIRPAQRYATATELVDAMRAALGDAGRVPCRALAVHVDAAPDAVRATGERLAALGMRPMLAGAAAAVWWCAADEVSPALAAALRELGCAIHAGDVELEAGQPASGALTELWRWTADRAVTQAARDILEAR